MNTEQKKIAVYSRKSKFTGKGDSIENQIEMCRQYVQLHMGGEQDICVYEDEGFSGGTLERPRFKTMMADARAGRISAIVVYRLDRISRNIGDFAKLIEELAHLKVAFVSVREQFDTETSMGRAMMYIASVFSQLERETIAERIRDNMHELAKTGRWLGGVTPTGYASEQVQKVSVDGKTRKACKLKLIPEEAEIVKTIFRVFLETNSLTKVDEFLLKGGYKTKNGKDFTRFAVKGILMNPVYMMADREAYRYLTEHHADLFSGEEAFDGAQGIMAYNRTLQRPGKANQIRPIEEWIVSVGKHPGLISGADWVKAQRLLEQNRDKGFRKPRSHVALLSGLLVCGSCGSFMRPKLSGRKNAAGETIYDYMCELKERSRSHNCKVRNVNGNLLDAMLLDELKKLSEDSSGFTRQLAEAQKKVTGNRDEYNARLAKLESELGEKETEIQGLVTSLSGASGTAAEGYILRQIEELHGRCEHLKERIEELRRLTSGHQLSDMEFETFREILASFRNTLADMSVEEKRAAIRTCVKKVVWDGENVHVYLFGAEGDCALPELPDAPDGGLQVPLGTNSK